VVVALAITAVVTMATITSAGASPARAPQAAAPKVQVGDCFAKAQVDYDEVTISSKVPCTKAHDVQVVGTAALPAALASAPLDTLTDVKSAIRPQLEAFADQTCTADAVAKVVYPKQAAALSTLFAKDTVTYWTPPAPGNGGWALPDAAAFDAGTKAVLCVFQPNPNEGSGSTVGDIRKISTRDPLSTLRLCFDFKADGGGTQYQSCDKVHDGESLLWVSLPVTGLPADPSTWSDAQWAPFDSACAAYGEAVIGAKRTDLKINSDTGTSAPANGRRLFNCRAYPLKDTDAIPAGAILAGAGKAKIKFTTK